MFGRASSFNKDISSWNTAAVTNMYQMFQHASSFNKDISSWNTAAVTDWSGMFYNATAWLASFHRVDGTSSTDGPLSAWSFIPSPPPPPPPLGFTSGASRLTQNFALAALFAGVLILY